MLGLSVLPFYVATHEGRGVAIKRDAHYQVGIYFNHHGILTHD
jgi:hypothetical protein